MADLDAKYKKIVANLEKNMENKNDLEYAKKQISNLFLIFFKEIDELKELYEHKVETIIQNQNLLNSKMSRMEKIVNELEDDIYVDEENDFEIICPYCNNAFVVQLDSLKKEVKCPECDNLIELDWNDEEDGCDGECSHCHGHHKKEDEEDDM